jgi:hypothetical protein
VLVYEASLFQLIKREVTSTSNLTQAVLGVSASRCTNGKPTHLSTTCAIETLRHVPLGAGIEERHILALLDPLRARAEHPLFWSEKGEREVGGGSARMIHCDDQVVTGNSV